MLTNKKSVAALLLLGAMLPACTSDQIEIPQEELYMRQFIKEFGLIDPSHDWNMAKDGNITIKTSNPTDVKIYANVDGKRYLFADYRQISGTKEISVDVPQSVESLIVRVNGKDYPTSIGSTIDLRYGSASRGGHYGDEDPVVTVSRTSEEDWLVLSAHDTKLYAKRMPEGGYNVNNDGVTSDFIFESEGDFIVYPIFWNTSQTPTFGVYYYDSEAKEIVYVDVYTADKVDEADENTILTKRKPTVMNYSPGSDWELDAAVKAEIAEAIDAAVAEYNIPSGGGNYYDANGFSCTNLIDGVMTRIANDILTKKGIENFLVHEWRYWVAGDLSITYTWNKAYLESVDELEGVGNQNEAGFNATNNDVVVSKGVKVHIKPGTLFGCYIRTSSGIFHSNRDRNFDWQLVPNAAGDGLELLEPQERASHAATWTGQKYGWTMLGFEDWPSVLSDGTTIDTTADFDLNDFVMMLAGATSDVIPEGNVENDPDPTPDPEPEDTPFEWIIAAEDLGNTYDWDFNDAVVSVSYIVRNYDATNGEVGEGTEEPEYTEVTVKPLAAGVTLPIYLMFDGMLVDDSGVADALEETYVIGHELHIWLGGSDTLTPINVGSKGITGTHTGEAIFKVKGQYSINQHVHAAFSGKNMGGFWVLVDKDGEFSHETALPSTKPASIPESAERVTPPHDAGRAPMMICVESSWRWPDEQVRITTVYPGFATWASDKTNTKKWY